MATIDVGAVLDEGRWTGYQKLLVGATALALILDGLDNQLLAAAIPAMMREWNQPRAAFASVLAAGLLGMMIGGAIGGYVGDRIGRRPALIASVLSFGVLTMLVALADSVTLVGALRFLAGLGLGGAMPNAAALSSEYVPMRHRPFAVTLTILCIPVGGALAGLTAAQMLPLYGWRALFIAGGVLPLVLGAILLKGLPESPRFLAHTRTRWPELASLLRRLGHDVPPGATFEDRRERAVAQGSMSQLFAPSFRRDTLALCASFFFCLLTVYIATNWVPSLLTTAGFSDRIASYGLTVFNLGGVVGAILGALAINRLGSRMVMLTMTAGAIAGALVLAVVSIAVQTPFAVLAMLGWTGGLVNAVQSTMYALAASVYPAGIRATGVGTAVAFGRIGGVVSPYAGAWALESGGASRLFGVVAALLTIVFAALASVRQHIPASSRRAASEAGGVVGIS